MSIRSTAKAVILDHGKVLLNRCHDSLNGDYYSLPGGGQNTYETLTDAVIRECLEETGYTVNPIRLAALCETICDSAEFRETHPDGAHKMFHIFLCGITGEPVKTPTEIDDMQIESEWIEVSNLDKINLLPKAVGENITRMIHENAPMFLGSAHIPYNHG